MSRRAGARPPLYCRDCPMWYGGEDDGWGPCSIKHRRGDDRYLTWGGHRCDEDYVPPAAHRPRAPTTGRVDPAPARRRRGQ
ncbi:MAG: hypothetical protein ACYCPN_01035 [Thermoplasmata archaeon]